VTKALVIALAMAFSFATACSKQDAPSPPPTSSPQAIAAAPSPSPGPPGPACPATGLWAECSVIYHLDRAGLAPHVDPGASPAEQVLSVKPVSLKIGQTAVLELYIYPDTATRVADGRRLDRTQYVSGTAPQTMRRERTLIESANVIGLLTSLNGHQRERVSDALTAGPPQPEAARASKPSQSSKP